MSLLGLDIGTSGVRAVAFSDDLTQRATATAPLREYRDATGNAELDPRELTAAIKDVLAAINAADEVYRDPVQALAIAPLGEATVALDADGRALDGIPLAADRRGTAQLATIVDRLGEDWLRSRTGQPVHPMFSVATWAWWRAQASWWHHVRALRCVGDFTAGFLSKAEGMPTAPIDTSMAARTLAYDTIDRRWSQDILDAAQIPEAVLPSVVPAGTPIGRLDRVLAAELGFVGRPIIVAGAHDQACAAFGAGVDVAGGQAVLSLGTTECLTVPWTGRPVALIDRDYAAYPVDHTDRYLTLAGIPAGGSALRWLADTFGQDLRSLVAAAETHSGPARILCQPHFLGSGTVENDEHSRAAFAGIDFATTPADFVLALWESSGFEMSRSLAVLAEAAAVPSPAGGGSTQAEPKQDAQWQVRTVGGGTASPRAIQARADATGLTLWPVPGPATARGAAMLAGVGIGLFGRPADAAALVRVAEPVEPNPNTTQYFTQRREQHRELYPALAPLDRRTPRPDITT